MMVVFRSVALLLLLGFGACTVLHKVTGDVVWAQRARQLLKWGVVLGLCFFGLVILRRAAVFI
jgi:hypothetical protein